MTETKSKIRALFLAGLMVTSVFAGAMAFTGAATARVDGNIESGDIVFIGEEDIVLDSDTYGPEDLQNSDGESLSPDIDEDTETGVYSTNPDDHTAAAFRVTVREPEIDDHEFRLGGPNGPDVAGGSVPADESDMTVWAEYNFGSAEDLEISVEEVDGLDVTEAAVESANPVADENNDGEVTFDLSLDDLDPGEYEVTLEGAGDIDQNDATVTDTFTISSAEDVTIELEESEVVQGDNVQYDIQGGVEGNYHVVSIDQGDITASTATDAFRNVGDVVDRGTYDGDAFALVEIDGGVAQGEIETGALDDTDVNVAVSEAVDPEDPSNYDPATDGYPDEADDAVLSVTEGEISLENPEGFYVPGADVMVNGTVSSAYDEVSVFVRDEQEYERVGINGPTISATAGEFEAEDVDLTDGEYEGNNILNYPGSYRFAVVAGSAPLQNAMGELEEGDPAPSLTSSELVSNVSEQITLRVSDAELEANTTIINGQVAEGDRIDVTGVASGANTVNATLFGPRGQVGSASGDVSADGTFDIDGIDVANGGESDVDFTQGTVIMSVGHWGRDGMAGDGQFPSRYELPDEPPENVEAASGLYQAYWAETGERPNHPLDLMGFAINAGSYTQQQAIDMLSSEVGGDTASDDQSQTFQFRLTSPRTTVDNVVGDNDVNGTVQVGNEMSVEGTTNRQPDQNSITVEVIDGPSADNFELANTDEWGTDGQWSVSMNTSGLQPGSYTVEASDGDSSDVMEFQLSESVDGEQNETDTPDTETETEAPDTETETEAPDTETNETGGDTDGQDGPGFGIAVALVALLAAALLAVRRDN